MGRPTFDDITPPQGDSDSKKPQRQEPAEEQERDEDMQEENPAEDAAEESSRVPVRDRTSARASHADRQAGGEHSIRDIHAPDSERRAQRRARRAGRRTLGDAPKRGSGGSFASSPIARVGLWGGAALIVVAILGGVGFLFIGKTTITVEPLVEPMSLSSNVVHTAYAEPEANELGYTVASHTLEAEREVDATGVENVAERASGRIRVVNTYSSANQRLIPNTRFEAPDGRIYRARDAFVVPGMEDEETPGTIEVTVYAEETGEVHNLGETGTRFTIPGLEGDPRYDGFHAELVTPVSGGYEGERAVVDEETETATRDALQNELRDRALSAVREQVGDDVLVFEPALFTTFESLPTTTGGSDDRALVRERARIDAVVFDHHAFAQSLARATLATPADGPVRLANPDALSFSFVDKAQTQPRTDGLVQFTLSGSTNLIWQVDTEELKQDLVGKHSAALNTVMSGYPGIRTAQATIRPFWRDEFPTETDSITVDIVIDEAE